ncbi:hypothetical protein V6N13_112644 [Hibiscus sabdariffa]
MDRKSEKGSGRVDAGDPGSIPGNGSFIVFQLFNFFGSHFIQLFAILYAVVARDTAVLAECSAEMGNARAVERRMLEKLAVEADLRLCFSQDHYIFYILRSDGLYH